MAVLLEFKKLLFLLNIWITVIAYDYGFSGFLFTAPKTLVSGKHNSMCILFKNSSNIHGIEIKILKLNEDLEIATSWEKFSKNTQNKKCFNIFIPTTQIKNGRLHLIIRLKTDVNFNINYTKQILIQSDPTFTFIQTDKPVYTGGQLLQFRIFSLKSDLTPAAELINEIWIENPNGIHLMQWLNESLHYGILNKTYQFSDEPLPGKWSIKIRKENGDISSRSFLIYNYDLPKFLVLIKSPEYISSSGNITVCAKYFFGQPVLGNVVLQYFIKCSFSYYCQENNSFSVQRFVLNQDGCINHEFNFKNLSYFAKTLIVNATVIENGTGKKAEASSEVEIKIFKPKNFPEFSQDTKKKKFKPGLPFKGKVIFDSQNNTNKQILICLQINGNKNCKEFIIKRNQLEFIILPVPLYDTDNFVATLSVAEKKKLENQNQSTTLFNLISWYSPSESYINLEKVSHDPLKCGEETKFIIIYSSTDSLIELNYLVKSKGMIVKNGVINTLQAKSFEYRESDNPINFGDTSKVKQIEFNITLLAEWSPGVSLLVFYIRLDGEVIADELSLTIEKCFSNRVKVKWGKSVVLPGFNNHLKIEASKESLCALTIVDKSTRMHLPFNSIIFNHIFENFDKNFTFLMPSSNGHCQENLRNFSNEDALSIPRPMDSRFVDSSQAFVDFGVLVITDLTLETRPCQKSNQKMLTKNSALGNYRSNNMQLENTTMLSSHEFLIRNIKNFEESFFGGNSRIFFPETWIWSLLNMNDSESIDLNFKVPDTVTEWMTEVICLSPKKGLGMAESSKFVTYKSFFLDFFVPHFVKRKEFFYLQVSVFNYESTNLPIKITYHSTNSFTLKSAEYASYCIKSKTKITHLFILEAIKLGSANISVSANIDSSYPESCGNAVFIQRDTVTKKIVIRHEGIPMEKIRSGFICGHNDTSFDRELEWNIKAPTEIIDNSISLDVIVSGDILGPAVKNLDNLISPPMGCGEQNMVLLVPNILLLDYLLLTKNEDFEILENALKNLNLGYQKQLNYKRKDHSYSAFGEKDNQGSIWLTAFVVRYFSQAKKYIYIDSKDLNSSVSWIIKQQMENGCFPIVGKIYHRNFQEKLQEEDSLKILTAYILIALTEFGVPKDNPVIKNAIYCLKPTRESLGMYGDLLSAYALISVGEFRDTQALMLEAIKEAKRSYQMLWWEDEDSLESSIEMTAYGILTLLKLGGSHFLAVASDALRWIIQYRNQNGGFISSQDTIVALEALSKFSAILPIVNKDDQLQITARTGERTYNFNITKQNKMLQQKFRLPSFTTNIHFETTGEGCALVQTYLQYNVRKRKQNDDLKIQLKINSLSDLDLNINVQIQICVKYENPDNKIGMAILEVNMISGYYPDRASLYDIRTSRKGVRRWEEYENKINFYFENLTRKKCVKFLVVQEACIEKTAPALIKLYNYYNIRQQTTMKYNFTYNCRSSLFNNSLSIKRENKIKRDLSNKVINRFFGFDNLKNNFVNFNEDLETPFGIEGIVPAFILPPRPGGQHCPHCVNSIPKMFYQFYCSSKLALNVRNLGQKILRLQYDVSPRKNITMINKNVTFNIQNDCDCFILKAVNSSALMLVLPSRAFDLDKVEKINADDSLQLYPWENIGKMPKYLEEAIQKCQRKPFNN